MKQRFAMAVTAGAAAAALAGCSSNDSAHMSGHTTTSHMMNGSSGSMPTSGGASATAGERDAADVMFAQMMIPHHQQAVEMAKLAAVRATDPQVKALAGRIKAAQDPEIATMRGWLTRWGSPMMMRGTAGSHGGMASGMMSAADMAKLKTLTGRAFDREFLTMMTDHHRGAIEMARTEVAGGRYAPAKQLAAGIVQSQTAEIATMAGLLKSA